MQDLLLFLPKQDDHEIQRTPATSEVALWVEDTGVGYHSQHHLYHIDHSEDDGSVGLHVHVQ